MNDGSHGVGCSMVLSILAMILRVILMLSADVDAVIWATKHGYFIGDDGYAVLSYIISPIFGWWAIWIPFCIKRGLSWTCPGAICMTHVIGVGQGLYLWGHYVGSV